MRVLFVDQFSAMGGAQFCLRDVLIEARRRGWHAEVAAPGNGPLLEFCGDLGVPAHSLPISEYRNGRKSLADFLRYGFEMRRAAHFLRGIAERGRIDVVYANGPRILPAAAAVAVPLIFHSHSLPGQRYARAIANRCIRKRNAAVIASSRFVSAPFRRAQCTTIYNGVEDMGFAARPRTDGPPHIGMIGRIAPEKNPIDFIRAAKQIEGTKSIFGSALFADPSYETRVRFEAAGTETVLRGWTADVAHALHELDVLVVPSSGVDATPRVILEAFAAGTPVVAYRAGGIPELIRHGETGLLTESPDPDSLARCLRDLLASPETMRRISENARREWETSFRVERFQREVCDLIESRHMEKRGQPQPARAVGGEQNLTPVASPRR